MPVGRREAGVPAGQRQPTFGGSLRRFDGADKVYEIAPVDDDADLGRQAGATRADEGGRVSSSLPRLSWIRRRHSARSQRDDELLRSLPVEAAPSDPTIDFQQVADHALRLGTMQ